MKCAKNVSRIIHYHFEKWFLLEHGVAECGEIPINFLNNEVGNALLVIGKAYQWQANEVDFRFHSLRARVETKFWNRWRTLNFFALSQSDLE